MSSKQAVTKEKLPRKETSPGDNNSAESHKDVKSSPFKNRFERDRTPPRFRGVREGRGGGRYQESSYGRRSEEDYGSMKRERPEGGGVSRSMGSALAREFIPASETRRPAPDPKPFTDESRLSKLVRRLCREDDRDRRLTAAKQLREIMPVPENVKVIIRNSDALLLMLHDVLFERTYREVKQEAAACIGTVGCVMGAETQRYFQWVFTKIQAAPTDDGRILLLEALLSTLEKDEEKNKLPEHIPIVMSNCQSVLENADTSDVLMAVVDVIVYIAREYPHVFGTHFRNTVDILVGWHIDCTQREALTQFTSEALVSFHEFWVSDMAFSVTLLGQFLEDMEAYAEDLGLGVNGRQVYDEDLPSPEECVSKIGTLLRVFTTVADSLKDYFNPEKGAGINWDYLFDTVSRIIRCIDGTIKNLYNEKVLFTANRCLLLLCGNLGAETEKICEHLLPFIINQVQGDKIYTNQYLVSLFKLIQQTVELVKVKVPVTFTSQLLSADSLLLRTRFATSGEVLDQLMKLYHAVLGLKSVPVMEEVYRHLLGDIENCFNLLLERYQGNTTLSLVSQNPYPDVGYSVREAKTAVIFNVCALAEVGNNKSNLIGMWALSPSLFDLFARHLLALDMVFLDQIPAVTYAIFQALYSHASRHSHFITSSNLLTQHTVLEGTLLANVSPTTGEHHSTVLALLADVLTGSYTPYDTRCLALKWSHDILEALGNTQNIYRTTDLLTMVESLITLGYTSESEISQKASLCVQSFLSHSKHLPEHLLLKVKDLCGIKMAETDTQVRESFTELLKLVPLDVSTRKREGVVHKVARKKKSTTAIGVDAFWLARKYHMTKSPMGTFHSHNFRAVMGFILENLQPGDLGSSNWLEKIYYSSQRLNKEGSTEAHNLTSLIDNNASLLWFWATWEAAQFCILAKLRTPLGKPQDTFMSIEASLKQYAAQIKDRGKKLEGQGHEETDGKKENGLDRDKPGDKLREDKSLLRVHLLLQFLEHLEKLLYNAYEGTAAAMMAPPKAVRTFFRTNRSTCLEWLNRIRLSVMMVAKETNQWTSVIRQGHAMIRDMKEAGNTQQPEFEQVLLYMVEALVELKCAEVIQGLYTWCKDTVGRKLTWMKGAVDMAAGRYESALTEYRASLRNLVHPDFLSGELDTVREDTLGSPGSASPFGSPSQSVLTDTLHKVAILSKDRKESTGAANEGGSTLSMEGTLASSLINQVCEGYQRLGSYEEVLRWQETVEQYRSEAGSESLKSALHLSTDLGYIRALAYFEDCDFRGLREEFYSGDSDGTLTKETDNPQLSWNLKDVAMATHRNYMKGVALCETLPDVKKEMAEILHCLSDSHRQCADVVHIQSLQWPAVLHHQMVTQLYGSSVCKAQLTEDRKPGTWLVPLCPDVRLDPQEHEVGVSIQTLTFLKIQIGLQELLNPDKTADFEGHLSLLQLATARLARKQQNFSLAESLLIDEVQNSVSVQHESESEGLTTIGEALSKIRSCNGTSAALDKLLRIEREGAKLLYDKGRHKEGINSLTLSVVSYADVATTYPTFQYQDMVSACTQMSARSLVTLVSWLQHEGKYLSALSSQVQLIGQGDEASMSHMTKNLKLLLELESLGCKEKRGLFLDEFSTEDTSLGSNPILGESDAVVGRLLHYSTIQCPSLSKAWFSLAGWCYKWGRKSVDNAVHGSIELSPQEKSCIIEILPKGTSEEETDSVLGILSQLNTRDSGEEDISDQDQSLYDDGTEMTRRQLLSSCLSLQIASDSCVESLIDVWRGVVKRVYHYYQLSAKAYFTYLKLNGQSFGEVTNMDGNITATLRILRLLVKHAWELRGVLEEGLLKTPTQPWKGIIPQLFSRLSHPESYVRQSVSELLCRVAQDAPHLIVYPAVVGASAHEKIEKEADRNVLLNEYLSQDEEPDNKIEEDKPSQEEEEEDTMATGQQTMLQNCFTAIVDTLAHSNPRMISEVQLLVSELRRITLLWDELWLGTLNQHHQDVTRRLTQLENEVKKVTNNSNLSKEEKAAIVKEKHATVLKPTVYTIERLHEITSQPPETKHEQWFQTTYGKLINDALSRLRQPSNPANPQASWQLFKQIHHSLQQKASKRNSLLLSMEEISGKLAQLKNTVIAMPGVTAQNELITIECVHNTLQILPTKTKPKKLVFLGSDGRKYPYLFKGLEDLHLDERIMQFLAIVNNMFAKSNRGERKLYHARYYSVTPLGARSGLIQWVDGATPLFSLYKRWQQREAVAQQSKGAGQTSGSTQGQNQVSIPRPSEVFYNKLTPLLKEKGISNLDNRREWPLSVMRRVLDELVQETPGDLLAKELWCCSTSATEWWDVTQTYCRSTAVMSIIGYIIGLGDRHLDNLLLDLSSGEVVHIDYNVCFEKGKSLRVSEKVPFRMTQNLEGALGVTGIEGQFRLSCEYVLKTMRKGRETLLTLLEAFVYDPLVDWTTGNEGGYTGAFYGGGHTVPGVQEGKKSKKEMEREITLSMFAIRVAEMKGAWHRNRDEMLNSLPRLQEVVLAHLKSCQDLADAEVAMDSRNTQRVYLEEAKEDPEHPLYTLPQRYEEYSVVKEAKLSVQSSIQEKLNECERWLQAHTFAFSAIRDSRLQKMCADVTKPLDLGMSCFQAVTEFLNGAGQQQLATQCEQVSTELSGALLQRRTLLKSCLDILHSYATIVSHYPASFLEQNRNTRWQHWLQELVCDFTTAKCADIGDDFQRLFGLTNEEPPSVDTLTVENKLQVVVSDYNTRLLKLVERRNAEGVDTHKLMSQVSDTSSDVHSFMREQGKAGTHCMTSVVVSALCSLTKRYLVMEGAAAAAADRLMDLTSRDGDWFLDELCSMSGNVNHLLSMLTDPALCPLVNAEMTQSIGTATQACHTVYLSLQDLNVNFRTIILPETLKTLQSEDLSVAAILKSLNDVIGLSGHSLDNLLTQLEKQLMNAIMGFEPEADDEIVTAVKKMKLKYEELLHGNEPETSDLSPGQMLLMGFNGLFTRLEADFNHMLDVISEVQGPEIWRKVDVIKEARSIQMTAFNETTVAPLCSLFFVKQMKAMQTFFHLSQQQAAVLQGTVELTTVLDDDQLAKPVKYFIAEYVRKHLIGLPSQTLGNILCMYINSLHVDVTAEIELKDIGAESKVSLEDLCKKAIDSNVKNDMFEPAHLTQATTLIGASDISWRKYDLAQRLDNNITVLKSSVQRNQLQLARFQWLYEDMFTRSGRAHIQVVLPSRTTVMSELRKTVQTLMSLDSPVITVQERHGQLEASITSRLKWAGGANPSVSTLLREFEETIAHKDLLVQNESSLCTEVASICNSVLHFEALRTRTPEAVSADAAFLGLVHSCEQACLLAESCTSTVSELEEGLMNTMSATDPVNHDWIDACIEQIGTNTQRHTSKEEKITSELAVTKEHVASEVTLMRSVLTTHHKLMSDIRTILKSLAKQEEHDCGPEISPGRIRAYLTTYKQFSENFTSLLQLVIRDDITKEIVTAIDGLVTTLGEQILAIYNQLVSFAPPLQSKTQDREASPGLGFVTALKKSGPDQPQSPMKRGPLQGRSDLMTGTLSSGPSSQHGTAVKAQPVARKLDKVARDPKTGKALQERNSYAVGVWRRIKMKLDGRDPDQNKRYTVPEQVEFVIGEAISPDNLCVLYEGWTSWV